VFSACCKVELPVPADKVSKSLVDRSLGPDLVSQVQLIDLTGRSDTDN